MEQVDYNLLFRWFVGLGIDDAVWVPTVFTKNRDRLLRTDMSRKVMAAILTHPEVRPLLSDEHFSVDGTLVKAWASMKSFQPKEGRATPGRGTIPAGHRHQLTSPPPTPTSTSRPETPTDARHAPPDPQRRSELPGREALERHPCLGSRTRMRAFTRRRRARRAMLCFMGHTLMENRNGLVVQAELTHADGHGERKRRPSRWINRHSPGSTRRLTLGADKGYDSVDFVAELRRMVATPACRAEGPTFRHRRAGPLSIPDTPRPKGAGKKIEEPFGWAKTVGGMAQTLHRGLDRVRAQFTMTMAACKSREATETIGRLTKRAAQTQGKLPRRSAFKP